MALSPLSPSKLNHERITGWFNNAPLSQSPKPPQLKSSSSTVITATDTSSSSVVLADTTMPLHTTSIAGPISPMHGRASTSCENMEGPPPWRESSSSPFLELIDQENVVPDPLLDTSLDTSPLLSATTATATATATATKASMETPTRRKKSGGLAVRASPCSPLTSLARSDATAAATPVGIASVGGDGGDGGDGNGGIRICTDETRTAATIDDTTTAAATATATAAHAAHAAHATHTASPEKRIADAMFASAADMKPSRCSTPTASPRTATSMWSGHRVGAAATAASASGLFSGSAFRYGGRSGGLGVSDGSPSRGFEGRQTDDSGARFVRDTDSPRFPRSEPMASAASGATVAAGTSFPEEQGNLDDTCFTAFSEIPNAEVTQYTKMPAGSPFRGFKNDQSTTPKSRRPQSPLSHSPSPTPRRHANHSDNDADTTNLLDFTQQMESFSNASRRSPSKFNLASSPMKFQSQPNLLSFINNQRSPAKAGHMSSSSAERQSILNLLDFELPPAPTPRSIPTVTARELESLKSKYLSEISSLKATLSGKCAEVDSLKRAVMDAERRVGQAQEELREECGAKEHAERERTVWEKKGKEVEEILQAIRKEAMSNEKEMEQLESRLQESERRAEDAEAREADAKAAAAEAERKAAALAADASAGPEQVASAEHVARQVQKELDEKIGAISSELHAVYKKKHETKVATLKKSYEARAEKKCAELQHRISELSKRNEEFQLSKDATFSGVLPKDIPSTSSQQADLKLLEEQKVEIEQQRAKLAGMMTELESVKGQHGTLVRELEIERAEKGELVAAAEEMLGLQHDSSSSSSVAGTVGVDNFRKSISRCSGLRPPMPSSTSFLSESRIGRAGGGSGGSGATGLARPVTGLKSRMMSNIERMGGGNVKGIE